MKNSIVSSVSGLKKLFLISFSVMMLSACGGGGSTPNQSQNNSGRTQELALQKISASTNNNAIVLNVQDYKNAGVVGVTTENIIKVNTIIVDLQPEDVDTKIEVQTIVDNLDAEPADTTAPIISLKGKSSVSILLGSTYSEAGVTITDNRDANIKAIITGTVNTNKAGTYTLTYTATDKAGNKATKTRTVTVVLPADTEKPVITLNGDSSVSIEQGLVYSDAGATATDARDGDISVSVNGTVDTHASGAYTITYTATDAAGNEATLTRNIVVQTKTTGDRHLYASDIINFSNQYGTSSWAAKQVLGEPNTFTYGDKSTAWTTSPSNGGEQTITVGYPEALESTGVTIRETYNNGFVTKVDVVKLDKTLNTVWTGQDPSQPGDIVDFTITWDKTSFPVAGIKVYIDTDHSRSYEETDSIQLHGFATGISVDNKAPVISMKGSETIKVEVGSTYTDAGATAFDDIDGNIDVIVTGSVDTSIQSSYILTYTATDDSANTATKTRTVTVVNDATKPVITLNGEALINLLKGTSYSELGATATDNTDGTVTVTTNGNVDTAKVGIYSIVYAATDQSGNSTESIRTVKVMEDTQANINTVVTGGNIQVNWSDLPASQHWIALVEAEKVNTTSYKKYFYTGGAINGSGSFDVSLQTEEQHFVITVFKGSGYEKLYISNPFIVKKLADVPDTEKPEITLNGAGTISLAPNSTYTEAGVTVTDDRHDDLTAVITGSVDTSQAGSYVLTYTAQDQAGNTATKTRTIIVEIPRPFITTWKTDNEGISDNNQIRIDSSGSGYNFNIDWGDGNTDTARTGRSTHTYAIAGTYTIKITGDFPYFENNDNKKLLSVDQWGTVVWRSMNKAFDNTTGLMINATDAPVLSDVKDMGEMFYNATNFNSNISHWDVSHVTNMHKMFRNAKIFNQALNSWDVSNVTDMNEMFYDAETFNQPLNNWDVSNVTNMQNMFLNTKAFNQSLNNWSITSLKNMRGMFAYSIFNQPIGNWDVSNVENMSALFTGNKDFNQNISNWDVSNVLSMNSMFRYSLFNQPIGSWNVSKVDNMESMFYDTKAFNQDISNWNVSSVTKMNSMFYSADVFNQNISGWDVSNVTQMNRMFSDTIFNQPIGSWDVSKVTDMRQMFYSAKAFNQDIDAWTVSDETQTTNMFKDADAMDNFPTWYVQDPN